MAKIILRLDAQSVDWVLAVEPWAYAYKIRAGAPVWIEAETSAEDFDWEFDPGGLKDGLWTIAVGTDRYSVTIGTERSPAPEV